MPKELVAADRFAAEQTRVTYIYSLLALGTLVIFGTLQIVVEGDLLLGALELAGAFILALCLACLRLTSNPQLVRHLVLLTMLGMLIVMLITGGTDNTGIFWMFIFPISAFFLTGKEAGVWWMFTLLVILTTFMVLLYFQFITLPYSSLTLRQLLVSLVVMTIGVYVYQQSRENLNAETQKSDALTREEKIKADIIVENIDEGVVVLDAQGHVILASKAAEDLLKWKRGDLIGQKFVDVVPMTDESGQTIPLAERPMQLALQNGERARLEARYVRKDNSSFPTVVASRAIIVDGRMHGAVSTFRDITEETVVDRAKSEFVTLASHQLRTPISAIAWVSELLLHGDAGKLTTDQMDYIQQIYHSNKRMAALVDAMLTVSSLELGSLPVRPEPVDLAKLSREVLQICLDSLPADKILHIKEHYDPKLPTVSFDAGIVKTILHNLITNAFKYTPNKGNVSISITQDNEHIIIAIKDTGLGIPSDQKAKLFTKLFRADNAKRKDTDGTGLGLFIVKTITEYAGGSLSYTSEENKGSEFVVQLPIKGMTKKEGRTAT